MKLVSVKAASAVIAAIGLAAGTVGVVGASTGVIGQTGDDSANYVSTTSATEHTVDANVENNNEQRSVSGDATVEEGDDAAGTAATGAAGNTAGQTVTGSIEASATADAATANSGSITAGSDSTNEVQSHTDYNTSTSVNIANNNTQNARSGNAVVTGNENGGSATTGAATNAATQSTGFTVKF